MKRISILLCSIGIAACTLTGCGKTMPELTEEENELITEYAVDVLLKYDKNYNNRLLNMDEYEKEKAAQEEIAALEEAAAEKIAKNEAAAAGKTEDGLPVEDTEVIDATAEGTAAEEEAQAQSIEEFYAVDGFTFQYSGCDVVDEYPEVAEAETAAFFAMEATEGTQLLVVKFQAVNQSGEEKELNMLNYGTRVKVSVNGESAQNALTTMLLNDLQTYKGVVPANESVELVSIVEVPEGASASNLAIVLKNESGSTTISLQ
ncbi:MAG: hypothetical protein J6B68_06690 [Lachnospiraceae bacterium]|nr:hypothetical protein [Lachnospiraceae bacterium]